jgi:hypothetical protein
LGQDLFTLIILIGILKAGLLGALFIGWTRRYKLIPHYLLFFYLQITLAFFVESLAYILILLDLQNAWLYNLYIPLEFVLLLAFAYALADRQWLKWVMAGAMTIYVLMLWGEALQGGGMDILTSRSILWAWASLAMIHTYLLIRLADRSMIKIWRLPLFWVQFGIILFMGGAIPYIGLINRMLEHDAPLASGLFVIIEVLFFLRYTMAILAGQMLPKRIILS